ncbi:YciI family protein [Flavihumibacter petaseus]|uniref:YCII-related domain-containing protein n=1 Tax=Flavihumibacter petaseus NBRC 106054 TaxID=1220578 RepID=A0A0E9N2I3_9BACT|nr:YciI family protein [Flavihumibacter petaseus]GAO44003.1 hypothetical protein FPE01S_03_00420 [Flavihumibacter petaseus NBRC 106054]
MNEFIILIHRDMISEHASPSQRQIEDAFKPYVEWVDDIAAEGKLIYPPKNWDSGGRVISRPDIVREGPYAESTMSLSWFFLIKARDYDEAVAIASGCPIIQYGAVVEVRMAV